MGATVMNTAAVLCAGQMLQSASCGAEAAYLSRDKLCEILKAVGKPPEVIRNPDGTTVVLLPYGGRVLGVYAPGDDRNFYWTHPALSSVESAKAFYKSQEWHNSGGDRTWLAPEVDIFLPDYPSTKTYFQPRELDPGNYEVAGSGQGVKLVNRLSLDLSRPKQKVSLEISKSIAPALNPLRYEGCASIEALEYAGYAQFTSLEMKSGVSENSPMIGLWNLVQMPHGGDLLIPTFSRTKPRTWFGNIESTDLRVTDHLVRYTMRAQGEHKLGVRAVATTGRVGYVYADADSASLIVRNFRVNPSGEYVDVPWGDPDDLGYSTQACNVNSALGAFSELEYHIPAIGGKTGLTRCDDTAEVWAFRGPKPAIRDAVRLLVSKEA